jgi:hypothetical protein
LADELLLQETSINVSGKLSYCMPLGSGAELPSRTEPHEFIEQFVEGIRCGVPAAGLNELAHPLGASPAGEPATEYIAVRSFR